MMTCVQATWEPIENLVNAAEEVKKFNEATAKRSEQDRAERKRTAEETLQQEADARHNRVVAAAAQAAAQAAAGKQLALTSGEKSAHDEMSDAITHDKWGRPCLPQHSKKAAAYWQYFGLSVITPACICRGKDGKVCGWTGSMASGSNFSAHLQRQHSAEWYQQAANSVLLGACTLPCHIAYLRTCLKRVCGQRCARHPIRSIDTCIRKLVALLVIKLTSNELIKV
jgi:hypothetical protein